jgi:peptide-methionine (S)-S-oxide reductase
MRKTAIKDHQSAIFALGDFWEPEDMFLRLPGVLHTEVGYVGGTTANPVYHNVGDHAEGIHMEFDPYIVAFDELLDYFWSMHDPTAPVQPRFRSGIFYTSEHQKLAAEESRKRRQLNHRHPILTEIIPAQHFYIAEKYHQRYLQKLRGEVPVQVTKI